MNKNKIFYLSGIGITFFGTSVFNFFVNWWLIKDTGTPELLGIITTISFIPTIVLNIFSGFFVDIWDKKKVLIICDIISGLACIVSFFFFSDKLSITIIAGLIITLKATHTFFSVASKSFIVFLFSEDNIIQMNKFQSIIKQISELTSPFISGMLILIISPKYFILINGISFIISALIESQLKMKAKKINKKEKPKFIDGFKYIYSDKKIFISIISASVANLFLAGANIMIPYISVELIGGSYLYSTLMAFEAIGAITAPLLMKYIDKNDNNYMKYLVLTALGITLCFPNKYLLCLGVFMLGFFISAFNISFFTYVQIKTPEKNIAKVTGVIYSLAVISMPIGTAIFTVVSRFTGAFSLVTIGLLFLITILMLNKISNNISIN